MCDSGSLARDSHSQSTVLSGGRQRSRPCPPICESPLYSALSRVDRRNSFAMSIQREGFAAMDIPTTFARQKGSDRSSGPTPTALNPECEGVAMADCIPLVESIPPFGHRKQHKPAADFAESQVDFVERSKETKHNRTKHGCLYVVPFQNFGELLSASQDYASHSGCRFRGDDFGVTSAADSNATADVYVEQETASESHDSFRAAKIWAEPIVRKFADRLRSGDVALVEEIERAFRLVMVESVRNAMMATFQRLELWPPRDASPTMDDDDCAYEDTTASLPEIAQRLHNDEKRRQLHLVGIGGLCRLRQRAMTAAFLIDFASEIGVALPEMSSTVVLMLADFEARVEEWEGQTRTHGPLPRDQSSVRGWLRKIVADAARRSMMRSQQVVCATGRAAMVPLTEAFFFVGLPFLSFDLVTCGSRHRDDSFDVSPTKATS
eukprot:TRINITY_DN3359_c0_g2_i1.p1 TRINITY_DN3359_c0_g2~~TRINITY_DN3359_c0_g2_i1.p1  ORF type:complete len:437 (-),score=44.06 TRINITY_DN3359_c0_g2_i1:426-1736(-)